MTRRLLAILAAPFLMLAPVQSAQAQVPDLSTVAEEDLAALVRFALPTVFRQVQTMCQPHLPRSSYIYAQSSTLTTRFETASRGSIGPATKALVTLSGKSDPAMTRLIQQLPPEVVGPFMSEMIAGRLAQDLKPDSCAPINRTMELLDPLPTDRFAELVAFLTIFMADQEKKAAAG